LYEVLPKCQDSHDYLLENRRPLLIGRAALREDKTFNQLGTEFRVHPVVVGQWKKQALLALPGVFGRRAERET
jgi:hypothetical protein